MDDGTSAPTPAEPTQHETLLRRVEDTFKLVNTLTNQFADLSNKLTVLNTTLANLQPGTPAESPGPVVDNSAAITDLTTAVKINSDMLATVTKSVSLILEELTKDDEAAA